MVIADENQLKSFSEIRAGELLVSKYMETVMVKFPGGRAKPYNSDLSCVQNCKPERLPEAGRIFRVLN